MGTCLDERPSAHPRGVGCRLRRRGMCLYAGIKETSVERAEQSYKYLQVGTCLLNRLPRDNGVRTSDDRQTGRGRGEGRGRQE